MPAVKPDNLCGIRLIIKILRKQKEEEKE